jgi:hypothetical protein
MLRKRPNILQQVNRPGSRMYQNHEDNLVKVIPQSLQVNKYHPRLLLKLKTVARRTVLVLLLKRNKKLNLSYFTKINAKNIRIHSLQGV